MLLAFGVVSGLLHARATGRGKVIDAAMIEGAYALMAMFHGLRAEGRFDDARGTHLLDGGAHFYDVYETADGRWVSIGALEPQFYSVLCDVLDLDDEVSRHQLDAARWPEFAQRVAEAVRLRTRDELDVMFAGTDACYAPVLSMDEVAGHPHHVARGTFLGSGADLQPAATPRFDGEPPTRPRPARPNGADTAAVLADAGLDEHEITRLLTLGVVADVES